MRHLEEVPQPDAVRRVAVAGSQLQRRVQRVAGVLDVVVLGEAGFVSQRIRRRAHRFGHLQVHRPPRARQRNRQPVDQPGSCFAFDKLVLAGVELPRLPVGVGRGVVGEEDVDLGREPRAVAAGVLPLVAGEERPGRLDGLEGGMGPEEVFVASRREQSEDATAVRQDEDGAAVGQGIDPRRFAGVVEDLGEFHGHGIARFSVWRQGFAGGHDDGGDDQQGDCPIHL